jgi:hypothetical protein
VITCAHLETCVPCPAALPRGRPRTVWPAGCKGPLLVSVHCKVSTVMSCSVSHSGLQHMPPQRACRPASADCMVLAARMARATALVSSGPSGPRLRNSTSDWPCPVFGKCTCSRVLTRNVWRHAVIGHRLLRPQTLCRAAARTCMRESGVSAASHLHRQRLGSVAAREGIRLEAEHTGCAAFGDLHGRR